MSTARLRSTPPVRLPLEHWGLSMRRGEIHAGGLNLNRLANRLGTPFYLFDEGRLRRNLRAALQTAQASLADCELLCSVKTNPYPRVLEMAREEGLGAEVISPAELGAARRARVPGSQTVFNGPGKTRDDLARAIRRGALIHVESASEAEDLARLSRASRQPVRAGIRVNPGIFERRAPASLRMGKQTAAFGLDPSGRGFRRAVEVLCGARHVELQSLSAHIGTGITTTKPFRLLAETLLGVRGALARRGIAVSALDFGGGYAVSSEVRYSEGPSNRAAGASAVPAPSAIATFADICEVFAATIGADSVRCLLEPGRLLVSDAFHLITRVVRIKVERGVRFAIVDASRVQNAIFVGRGYHEMVPLRPRAGLRPYTVVGPLCANFDVYCRDRRFPALSEGDVLAVLDVGAYNLSAQSQWSFEPAPVVTLAESGTVLAPCSWRP
jgi:diaminopimelate decarboxylase